MKSTTFAGLLVAINVAFAAVVPEAEPNAAAEAQLVTRDDCGAGGAPYTRRTNSPCSNPKDHSYCGCDETGIVRCR